MKNIKVKLTYGKQILKTEQLFLSSQLLKEHAINAHEKFRE